MSAVRERSTTSNVLADLDDGFTLPTSWYTDPEIFALERTRIFRRAWHFVGHADRLRSPGDRLRTTIADVPIAVVRDQENQLNAFVNVCRHRQHAVVVDDMAGRYLRCRYHGWTYNLDGTLRNAPRSQACPAFDPAGIALERVEVDVWGPLIFARLRPEGPTLAEVLDDLPQLAEDRGVVFEGNAWRARETHELACNWKVYVENACECYHCALAHPALARTVDIRPDAYALDAQDWYLGQTAPRRGPAGAAPSASDPYAFQFYYVWPTFFLGTVTGSGSYATHRLEPLGVDRCRLVMDYYFPDDVDDATVAAEVEANTTTLREDKALVASAQAGLRSGAIPRGYVMLPSERLVAHFQRMVVRELDLTD